MNNSQLVQVVNQDCDIALNIDDTFGLLPESFWFKVLARRDDLNATPDLDEMELNGLPPSTSHSDSIFSISTDIAQENVACAEENDRDKTPDLDELELQANVTTTSAVDEHPNDDAASSLRKRKLPAWMSPNAKKSRPTDDRNENVASTSTAPTPTSTTIDQNAATNDGHEMSDGDENMTVAEPHQSENEQQQDTQALSIENRLFVQPADESGEPKDVKVKLEPIDEQPDYTNTVVAGTSIGSNSTENVKIKKEEPRSDEEEEDDGDEQATGSGLTLRPSCTFGIRCYR